MKKTQLASLFACLATITALLCAPFSAAAAYTLPDSVKLSAQSALVVSLSPDPKDDVVLFEQNPDTKLSPAAVVRVMVGALALEIIKEKGLDMDKATGTYDASCDAVITGTGLAVAGMQLKTNETWTLRDLVTAALILPAADACVTLAVTLAGSNTAFIAKMNEKAKALGCTNTNFANVHGLDAANQYTTAADMYKIMRYAMNFAEFATIMKLSQYTLNPVSGGTKRTMVNQNPMVRPSAPQYYSPMTMGRTGVSDFSGRAMVSVAKDSSYEYMVIVLGCKGEGEDASSVHYTDTKALFKWAFNNFELKTLLSRSEPLDEIAVTLAWDRDTVALVPAREFVTVVANDLSAATVIKKTTLYQQSVAAPVEAGTPLGKVELYVNLDQKIGEVELVAAESVERSQILDLWEKTKRVLKSPWFIAIVILLVALLIGYIILTIVHNHRRRRRRMKRVTKYK